MCNFNLLSDQEKKIHHEKLLECANKFGGVNFFLQLLEAIRETKPHPLIASNAHFEIELGVVTWNKEIYNDKLQVLLKARVNESEQDNLLPPKDTKNYKKILNAIRTLNPIVFHVKPADSKNGSGFFFQPFDTVNTDKTKLNPLFDALFFCSIETVKKALTYTIKS